MIYHQTRRCNSDANDTSTLIFVSVLGSSYFSSFWKNRKIGPRVYFPSNILLPYFNIASIIYLEAKNDQMTGNVIQNIRLTSWHIIINPTWIIVSSHKVNKMISWYTALKVRFILSFWFPLSWKKLLNLENICKNSTILKVSIFTSIP